jgi:hypothetical protein
VTPYAEGQYKAFVKLNEGSTAQDAFEEIVHNIFDIDIAEGRITKEQAREWVSQTAAAGVAKYKFGTDAEVRESMAQIAQDFARNKLDQTNLPSSFVAFLKKLYTEFVEFMRRAKLLDQAFADGKIDADFERYLMGKIGLSDASMIEREVNRIEGEQGGSQQIDLFQDSRATPEAGADVRTVGDTKIVGPTSFAIRAFHGTPHEVDEFSTEKIGTGEGAQVYGWGLYFARNREVADHYRESLSPYTFHEGERELHGNEAWAAQFLINNGKDKAKAIDNADWVVANARDKAEVIQYIQKLSDADTRQNEGNLYGVTIDAEDHELLDWDKPLSEQPKEFQQTLREMWARSAKSFPALDPNGNPVAGQIYHIYEQHRGGNSEAVSQELNEAGIKGIRYLDNGSRGAYTAWQIELEGKHKGKWAVFQGSTSIGEYFDSEDAAKTHVAHLERQNTHNFVIFDGKHIQITEKNGQPVSVEDVPVDGGKSFSIRARDEAYDAAVKSGDEAEQQRLVDEAAKEAGYGVGPVYHGTNTEINQFDKKKAREGRIGKGFYFTPNRESAENYAADSVRMKGGEPVVKGYYLKDPNSYMDSIYVATDPSQIKSADPITRDDAGNVIPLSQRFNPESNDIRFSIQSQEQIDRVNKAVADTTQFAEGRMALYERAKERFKAVLAENKDILDALKEGGAAPEKIRRAKLIQGIAELEVILRQLPAEVRGKVGGFGVLARGGTGDAALAGFFKNRLQIIDRELEKYLAKEYLEKIETTLQNAKPRKGDNGVKKSTLGAVVQEFADKAYAASLLDNDATVDQLESLEKKIAKADDPKKEADLVEEWAITNTFGALAEQSSSKLKTALDYLKKEIAGGRAARKAAEQARIDDIRAKQGVISDALPGWTDSGLNKVNSPGWWEETKDLARQMVWSHASYEQILRRILPPEAQGIVEEWSNRIRRANGKTEAAALKNWQNLIQAIQSGFGGKGFMKTADALSELGEKREGKVSKLEGRQVELESIPIDKAEQLVRGEMNRGDYTKADLKQIEDALIAMPIESRKKYISIYRVIEEGRTESIPMTFDEMIFTTMAWDQTDVRVKMENSGWTQESYDQMVKEIASSKVATAVRDYLKDFYRNSTKEINPVYSRMFGMGLPDNPDYAPTSYESRKASGEMSPDGSAAQNTTTPGFAKARVTHNEAFKITPATQIYQQRSAEQAQWVAFAELHREMSAVLNSKNVRLSMKQENGKRLSELMSQVLDNIAKGGGVNTDAAYMKKWLGAATSGTAVASMSYNLKTIFNQFDAVTRFLYAMPLKDVMRAISNPQKVLESVPKSWESEVVQNRVLQGSNPAARFALKQAGMTPGKFLSAWYGTGAAGLMPMQYADGALTSLSSAMVYSDAHAKALAAGLSEKDADARALDAMDAAIWRFSQPVMFSAKSPVENNSGATMKLLYMFASDARLKTGILIDAVQSIKDGKGSKADHFRRIGVVFLGAMLAQTVSNIYRDIFSDDDDDEIWTAAGYGKAAALAPFQGFFLLGTAIDVALSSLTGQRAYSNSSNPLVNAGNNAIVAGKHASDILQTDDMEAFFKELGRIARAISLTPVTAVPAAVLNPVKPIVGAKKNLDKGSD